jgi:isoleucyl-tRNA synthetase
VAERPLLDRWVLGELTAVTADVTAGLEGFDTAAAGRRLAAFIDDLSNWYVRRSRRRFWEGPGTPGGAAAFATLYQCLETLTRLMAPIVPFLTEHVWGILRPPGAPDSVHLASWPTPDPALADEPLSQRMALVRRLVELGRSARAAAGIGVRQPLPRALVAAAEFTDLPGELRDQIASELNVRSLEALGAVAGDLTDYVVKPNFRALGRRFGRGTQAVAAAVAAADPEALAGELRAGGAATVTVAGDTVTLGADELIVTQTPRVGWTVASEAGDTVALATEITPELRREGAAREVIRLVQDARKADGLDVSDRIVLWWESDDPEVSGALSEHGALIAAEVLAVGFHAGPPGDGSGSGLEGGGSAGGTDLGPVRHRAGELDLTFWLRRA